jgi:hypothetical protein
VAPAWFPLGAHLLAYVDSTRRLRVVEADTARTLATASASPGLTALGWSADGRNLLEMSSRGAWLRSLRIEKLAGAIRLGKARRVPLPASAIVRAATYAPRRHTIAALVERHGGAGAPRSEALLIDGNRAPRRLFAVSGRLSQLAWSPDGSRLLLAWPAADQWLFAPTGGRGHLRAIGNIASVFSPGHRRRAPFPRIEGWCCAPAPDGSG